MALTPEEVVNQKFTITKFRDGYDLDQVDDFLDTIVEVLREHELVKNELEAKLAAAVAEIEELRSAASGNPVVASSEAQGDKPAAEQTIVVETPAPDSSVTPAVSHDVDAIKSSAMLQLALELHDKYVSEGETQRDHLISEAETKATQLVASAEDERTGVLTRLERERTDLKDGIRELREFESEYRSTLRSYIQSQLRNLDGSPEPGNAPTGVN